MKRKLIMTLAIALSLLFCIPTGLNNQHTTENAELPKGATSSIVISHTPHDYIWIMDNSEFADQAATEGWSGDGSSGNPYIIEGYLIDVDFSGITIYPTTVHFIIRDCIITGVGYWGIRLNSVVNGVIDNCTIYGKESDGVYISGSSNVAITDCEIYDCGDSGIYVKDSSNITANNNTISNCTDFACGGIYFTNSYNVTMDNNQIQNIESTGISFSSSSCTITNNTITNASTGIGIGGADIHVFNNTISNVEYSGISCTADNSSIVNNTFAISGGIRLSYAVNCLIANNTVTDSSSSDLYSVYSSNCTVIGNEFQTQGLEMYGTSLEQWLHNFSDNEVRGKDLGFFLNLSDLALDGNNFGQIFIVNCDNVSVTNGVFNDLAVGTAVAYSRNCTLEGLTIDNSGYGIYSYSSENCSFVDNSVTSGGILILGAYITQWLHYYSNNQVNGKPLGTFTSLSHSTIDASAYGQVIIASCSNFVIENAFANDTVTGISIAFSNSSTLQDCTVNNTSYAGFYVRNCLNSTMENCTSFGGAGNGIRLSVSDNCTITESYATGHLADGIDLYYSDNCTVSYSNTSRCMTGFHFYYSENCTLEWAKAEFNQNGIGGRYASGLVIDHCMSRNSTNDGLSLNSLTNFAVVNNSIFTNSSHDGGHISPRYSNISNCIFSNNGNDGLANWGGDNLTITANEFSNNVNYGLMLHHASYYSIIYNNTFLDNIYGNGYCYSSPNQWDDGLSLGNWWDDLSSSGPYLISGPAGVYDNYPIGPINIEDRPDVQYHAPISGRSITWSAFSANPDSYTVFLEDEEIDSDVWDGSSVTVPIQDGLAIGSYNYTLLLNDTTGDNVRDTVIVTVYDNIPTITEHSDASTITHVHDYLYWHAFDSNPSKYIVYENDTQVYASDWDGGTIIYGMWFSEVGTYNYTLFVNDTSGQSTTDSILVFVTDPAPTIKEVVDIEYYVGTVGNHILWNVTDQNPTIYEVYRNSAQIETDTLTDYFLNFSIDGLNVGEYNYTFVVYDESNNLASDTVIVTVVDSIPEINSPDDLEYTFGSTGISITWTTADTNPESYNLYRNGSLIDSDVWNKTSLTFSIDGLDVGTYNYTLVIIDSNDNSAADTIFVEVTEDTTTTSTTSTATTSTTTTSTTVDTNTTTTLPPLDDTMTIAIVMGIAVAAGIIVIAVMVFRKR